MNLMNFHCFWLLWTELLIVCCWQRETKSQCNFFFTIVTGEPSERTSELIFFLTSLTSDKWIHIGKLFKIRFTCNLLWSSFWTLVPATGIITAKFRTRFAKMMKNKKKNRAMKATNKQHPAINAMTRTNADTTLETTTVKEENVESMLVFKRSPFNKS